jgi:hypothetical protein
MMSAYSFVSAALFVLLDIAFFGVYMILAGYAWLSRLLRRQQAR